MNKINYIILSRWGFVHITQCRGFVTNGSHHWIYANLTRSVKKLIPWSGGHVVHQCGVLMVDAGLLPFVTNPLHWVMCTKPLQSAQSCFDC